MGEEQRHATEESDDHAHCCRACDENVKAGLNPDGTERVCHCGDGFDDHRDHTHTHTFVEYNASSLECPRIVRAVERFVAAERKAFIEAIYDEVVSCHCMGYSEGESVLRELAQRLEDRWK